MFQYSLRGALCVVLTTAVLYGLTFKMYSGGFTPGTLFVEKLRGGPAPKGEHWFGNFSTLGEPFTTYEIGATWISEEGGDKTLREHQRFFIEGAVLNLVFWFMFTCLASFIIRLILRRRKPPA